MWVASYWMNAHVVNTSVEMTLHIASEWRSRFPAEISEVSTISPPISLIVCDEGLWDYYHTLFFPIWDLAGHRLKSANNMTSTMFKVLHTPRRIILSRMPIQNDLSEFHAMVGTLQIQEFWLLFLAQYKHCIVMFLQISWNAPQFLRHFPCHLGPPTLTFETWLQSQTQLCSIQYICILGS